MKTIPRDVPEEAVTLDVRCIIWVHIVPLIVLREWICRLCNEATRSAFRMLVIIESVFGRAKSVLFFL